MRADGEPGGRSEWGLTALGTGGIGTRSDRAYPSLLVSVDARWTLVDAGDGTVRQLSRRAALRPLETIILTALTTERVGGLVSILDNPDLRVRHDPPSVVGPAGTRATVHALKALMADSAQVGEVIEVTDHACIDIGLSTTAALVVVDKGPSGAYAWGPHHGARCLGPVRRCRSGPTWVDAGPRLQQPTTRQRCERSPSRPGHGAGSSRAKALHPRPLPPHVRRDYPRSRRQTARGGGALH